MKLARDKAGLLQTVLANRDNTALEGLLPFAPSDACHALHVELQDCLHAEESNLRCAVLAFFAKSLPASVLGEVLEKYLAVETYYYDIVCRADRVLFAPEPLAAYFKSELTRRHLSSGGRAVWKTFTTFP